MTVSLHQSVGSIDAHEWRGWRSGPRRLGDTAAPRDWIATWAALLPYLNPGRRRLESGRPSPLLAGRTFARQLRSVIRPEVRHTFCKILHPQLPFVTSTQIREQTSLWTFPITSNFHCGTTLSPRLRSSGLTDCPPDSAICHRLKYLVRAHSTTNRDYFAPSLRLLLANTAA